FDPKKVLAVGYSLELSGYDVQRARLFQHQLMSELAALPGVESVSPSSDFGGHATVVLPGEDGGDERRFGGASHDLVGADYLQTMGIPMVQGRGFTASDVDAKSPVLIVSQGTASALWPNQDPIGRVVRMETRLRDGRTEVIVLHGEVIGVARDSQL